MPIVRILRYTLVSCGLTLVVAAVVAAFKLLPFALKSGVALRTVGPLAAAAFATVVEVAVLVGTPAGFAWATQIWGMPVPLGSAIGSAETRPTLGAAIIAGVLWAMVTFTLGGTANVKLATPGRVANNLVASAHAACRAHPELRVVAIPILGNRWECRPGGEPRLVGELLQSRSGATYSAAQMTVSDDLTFFELVELRLAAPAAKGRPSLRLAVTAARIRGAWPLARPARLGDLGRAAFVSIAASALGILSIVCLRGRRIPRWMAVTIGLLMSVSAWLTLLALDNRDMAGQSRYTLVPAAGCTVALIVYLTLRRSQIRRIFEQKLGRPQNRYSER